MGRTSGFDTQQKIQHSHTLLCTDNVGGAVSYPVAMNDYVEITVALMVEGSDIVHVKN